MTQTTEVTATGEIAELAERYGEAWNAQDLEVILALHAPDGVFELHVPGGAPGARVEVEFVDSIVVADALIQRKDSYLDALSFERQLGARS